IDHDEDISKILRGRAHEAWPADIDFLDEIVERNVRTLRRLSEWIEVHHDEIDGADAVLRKRGAVGRPVPAGENSAMNLRMEGLHPAVQHLGESRDIGDANYGKTSILEGLGSPPSRDEFPSHPGQRGGKWDQTGLL